MSSYVYWHSRYKDKTVAWPSYLYDGNPHTWKDNLETGLTAGRARKVLSLFHVLVAQDISCTTLGSQQPGKCPVVMYIGKWKLLNVIISLNVGLFYSRQICFTEMFSKYETLTQSEWHYHTEDNVWFGVTSCLCVPRASYQIHKLRVAHAPEMPGTFSPPPRVSDTDIHHGTCVACHDACHDRYM